jgi:uncharacterized protein YciI
MLQFLITAYDGTDADAPARRKASKEAHVALGKKMMSTGHVLFSTAILDDDDQTIGSCRVMQFATQAELDEWLEKEPYVNNKVWQKIDVRKCRMGPLFEWMTLDPSSTKLDETTS